MQKNWIVLNLEENKHAKLFWDESYENKGNYIGLTAFTIQNAIYVFNRDLREIMQVIQN